MNEYTEQIQQISQALLKENKVAAVIGYRQASLAHMTQPFIARTPQDAEFLMFNKNCRMNLTNYLNGIGGRVKGRVGIVVKGCDSRNLVTQLVENRVKREAVYIIGVPCSGLSDKNHPDKLQDNCSTCIQRNPVIYDVLAGPQVPELEMTNRFADVEKIEAMNSGEKQVFFDSLLENCIRCYACRDACPLCYCPTCFVDESSPQWVGKTTDPVDVKTYHLLRAFHDAGRCTDCGACEAACPMDIKVRHFTRKTIKDCVAYFKTETGMSEGQRPALDRFTINDPEAFIR